MLRPDRPYVFRLRALHVLPSVWSEKFGPFCTLPSVPAKPRAERLAALEPPRLGEAEKILVEWSSDVDDRPVWHVVEQAAVVRAPRHAAWHGTGMRTAISARRLPSGPGASARERERARAMPGRLEAGSRGSAAMQVGVPVRAGSRPSAVSATNWAGLAAPLWIEEPERRGGDDDDDDGEASARLADVLIGDLFWSAACLAEEAQWTLSVGEWDKSDCR
jgi:hypothetical protein